MKLCSCPPLPGLCHPGWFIQCSNPASWVQGKDSTPGATSSLSSVISWETTRQSKFPVGLLNSSCSLLKECTVPGHNGGYTYSLLSTAVAVVVKLIPSFPWAWLSLSARLGNPEPLLLHVLMDADRPSHTPDSPTAGTDSCHQTVNPSLHSSESRAPCAMIAHSEAEEETLNKKSEVQAPTLGMPPSGDATAGRLGCVCSAGKMGIVTLALPVLQGACGSQMRSRAGKCPADSKVWSNYEGLRMLLLSTHSNCSGSGGNKHTPSPRSWG